LLDQLENALDTAHSEFALASMDGIADSADIGSGLVCTRQLLKQQRRRCAARTIRIADAMTAALAAQMLAQKRTGVRIKQTHKKRVALHMHLTADPSRRRSIVGRSNLDAARISRRMVVAPNPRAGCSSSLTKNSFPVE